MRTYACLCVWEGDQTPQTCLRSKTRVRCPSLCLFKITRMSFKRQIEGELSNLYAVISFEEHESTNLFRNSCPTPHCIVTRGCQAPKRKNTIKSIIHMTCVLYSNSSEGIKQLYVMNRLKSRYSVISQKLSTSNFVDMDKTQDFQWIIWLRKPGNAFSSMTWWYSCITNVYFMLQKKIK